MDELCNDEQFTKHLDDNLELEQEDLRKCFSLFMAVICVFNLTYLNSTLNNYVYLKGVTWYTKSISYCKTCSAAPVIVKCLL